MDVDELGFNCFKICRSSEKEMFENESNPENGIAHTFDYEVFTFYDKKLGRIQVQTFHVRWNWNEPTVQDEQFGNDSSVPYIVNLIG